MLAARPLVSVVIPTYNRAHLIARALSSVLMQDYDNLEVLVVDDGSTDHTLAVVQGVAEHDPRVRVLVVDHGGAAKARNKGLSEAAGEWIAFLDTDDLWEPTFVSALLAEASEDDRNTIIFCSHRLVELAGAESIVPPKRLADPAAELAMRNPISTQTALVPAELVHRGLAFDPELRRFQDWDLWLLALQRFDARFRHCDETLATLFRQADSISEGSARIRRASLVRILVKHRALFLRRPRALLRITSRIVLFGLRSRALRIRAGWERSSA